MARIKLSEGFSVIPEGTHVFKITGVDYNETFGKLEVKCVTADGKPHTERFKLVTDSGAANEGAIKAFSYFVRIALDDMSVSDVDPQELVGHYFAAEVIHDKQESNKEPGKIMTFVNLGNKYPASGFESSTTVEETSSTTAKETKSVFDILDGLGG